MPNQTKSEQGEETTLTTLLQDSNHEELFLQLIQDCSSGLRQDINSIFVQPSAEDGPGHEDVELVLDAQEDPTTELKKKPPMVSMGSLKSMRDDFATKQQHKTQDAVAKELHSEESRDLRKKALKHYDDWSSTALGRVEEELKLEMKEQDHQSGSGAAATSLTQLPEAHRVLILHSCVLLLLGSEKYTAESRVFLRRLAESLSIDYKTLVKDETQVAEGLVHAAEAEMNADEETKKRAHDKKVARRWKIGLGAAAGAALIGVTGGLAAPLLAAGVASVMGGIGLGTTAAATYLGAMAGSAGLIGTLFGAYGGKMAGEMVANYAKEVTDFAFIPVRKSAFRRTATSRRLRVAIGISGWITEPGEVVKPWQIIGKEGFESYALRWELNTLLDLGNALTTYAKSAAWGYAKNQIISHTILAALSAALWPLGIAKAARFIDNPFSLALQRSWKAGKVLADALINKVQGERPVTLLGYSLGARVIMACLEELANRHAFGLVEDVVLAGSAVSCDPKMWRKARAVVSGRIVNAYSANDYMLAFLFRTHNFTNGVAGLQRVENVNGVENVDVSSIVESHFEYRFLTGQIMNAVGLQDIDHEAVKRETEKLKREEAEVEAERRKKEEEAKQQHLSPEDEAKAMEETLQKKRSNTREKMNAAMAGMKDKFSKMSMKPNKTKDDKASLSDASSEYNLDISTKADGQSAEPGKNTKTIGSTVGGLVPGPG